MADKATKRNGRGRQMTQAFAPRKLPGTATGGEGALPVADKAEHKRVPG